MPKIKNYLGCCIIYSEMEVLVLLVRQLNKKKDDGNHQHNFVIPIVPVKKEH